MITYLQPALVDAFIKSALSEDVGLGDYSTLSSVPKNAQNRAKLLVKQDGILAGVALAEIIFKQVSQDLIFHGAIADGAEVKYGDIAFTVDGPAQAILTAERLVLNCMQRMSGIATVTNNYKKLIQHTKARLLDTRKTTPNFRLCEKWAVAIGGGVNHRFGLYDMIMLKDNHVDFSGGIAAAINAANAYVKANNLDIAIEIETRNLDEVNQVLSIGGVRRIMLDNMTPAIMLDAVALIAGRFETEASGGITADTIVAVAETGVDYISVGALTHSAGILDLSLKAF